MDTQMQKTAYVYNTSISSPCVFDYLYIVA